MSESVLAPTLRVEGENVELPVKSASFNVDCQIAVAFVTLTLSFFNSTQRNVDALFLLPTTEDVTVTEVNVNIFGGASQRYYATAIIPKEDLKEGSGAKMGGGPETQYSKYNPREFVLPIKGLQPNETVDIRAVYFQTLRFRPEGYRVTVPLQFSKHVMPQAPPLSWFSLSCFIDTGTPHTTWGDCNYPMQVLTQTEGRIGLTVDPNVPFHVNVFNITYNVRQNDILSTLIISPPGSKPNSYDQRGDFTLFLAPPRVPSAEEAQRQQQAASGGYNTFGRSLVFLLDRSGSMSGTPLEQAKEALVYALESLVPKLDWFTIIAFDHNHIMYSEVLVQANATTIPSAISWVHQLHVSGATDILTPLQKAISILHKAKYTIPYCFLITDGCVDDEREICRWAGANAGPVRISTFGIGGYCNAYFLKMLATIGRGFSDTCLLPNEVTEKMCDMLVRLGQPILTDLTFILSGVQSCEMYPFPLPDLFSGACCVISGKYTGVFPSIATLQGKLPNGQMRQISLMAMTNPNLPLDKIFAKQQLDLLTSQAWLMKSKEKEEEAVALSVNSGLPCSYTVMAAYETTPEQQEKLKKENEEALKNKEKRRRTNNMAAFAVGGLAGLVILGVATGSFGSVSATLSNAIPSPDGIVDVIGGAQDVIGGLGQGVVNMAQGAGDFAGDVVNAGQNAGGQIWETVQNVPNCCGDMFDGLKNGLGDVCSNCADGMGECASGCGTLCGDLCENIGPVCLECLGALEGC